MGRPLSMGLRGRFARLMSEGLSASAAGKRSRVSRATAVRWGKRYRDRQALEPLRIGPPKGERLSGQALFRYGRNQTLIAGRCRLCFGITETGSRMPSISASSSYWHQSPSRAPWSSLTIWPCTRARKPPRYSKRKVAGSCTCPPYRPDLNPIELAFSKIKATCARSGPEPSNNSSRPSTPSATCSPQRNAGTTSSSPDMPHDLSEPL